MKAIVVVEMEVHEDPGVASAQIAASIRAIRDVRTKQMTDEIIIGLGEVADSVIEYLKDVEQVEKEVHVKE